MIKTMHPLPPSSLAKNFWSAPLRNLWLAKMPLAPPVTNKPHTTILIILLTGSCQCCSPPLNPKHCQRQTFRESRQVPQQLGSVYRRSEDAQIFAPQKLFKLWQIAVFAHVLWGGLNSATWKISLSEELVVFPNQNCLH